MKFTSTIFILFCAKLVLGQKADLAFTIHEKDLIPEGITFDPGEEAFYMSSIQKRKVVKISNTGQVTDFISSGQDEVKQVLGMTVYGGNLWLCNNTPEHDTTFIEANVHVYNLKTKKLVRRFTLNDRKKHLFNDLFITKTGDAYITDSHAGAVYRVKNGSTNIEEFIAPGSMEYPNGITGSADETKIFISTGSARGIVSANLTTKEVVSVPSQRYFVLGYDGLYRYKNSLIGIQNVLFPEAIHKLELNEELTEIGAMKFLYGHDDRFSIPTTGVVVGDAFYFIANSQLSQIAGNQGKIRNPETLTPTYILKLKLN
jgi:DNA-binding beta-propeller fold protein YncE